MSLLAIRGLKTAFGGRVIHDGLELDIEKGEVLVLLGKSGAGKSTLLRTLNGLDQPVAGSCHFEDVDLYALSESAWPRFRTRIAYAFQNGALFDSLTVGENLEFPLREHTKIRGHEARERVRTLLASLGLGDVESLRPGELSGGMQKRVGLARAIILEPDVVLYDEPTAGLDPQNLQRINETILQLKAAGKTSVVVTHDEACAKTVADRFAFVDGGKIAVIQDRAAYEKTPDPALAAYFSGGA